MYIARRSLFGEGSRQQQQQQQQSAQSEQSERRQRYVYKLVRNSCHVEFSGELVKIN